MAKMIFYIVFGIVVMGISYYYLQPKEKQLPVINPVDVHSEMVDESLMRKGYGHTIQDFVFTDQQGEEFNSDVLKGKVYVAEYFFTTCKTICPKMNSQMQRVQKAFSSEPDLHIVSFTVDPEVDTVAQMKRYAEDHGANPEKWHFLTGEKAELYDVARKSFFVLKPAEAQNLGDAGSDFIHTNNFVLVDTKGRIRGYYDGTSPKEVSQLLEDIQTLLKDRR